MNDNTKNNTIVAVKARTNAVEQHRIAYGDATSLYEETKDTEHLRTARYHATMGVSELTGAIAELGMYRPDEPWITEYGDETDVSLQRAIWGADIIELREHIDRYSKMLYES
jgi:hypothetical protein